jgi:predicted NBD/HSP70 family sugar kinase
VRGSAEALCGITNIERLARIKYQREGVTAREVIEASRMGTDTRACQIMEEIGSYLGHLLAILSPIFFPKKILVTGGTAEAGEPFFIAIRKSYFDLIGDYMINLTTLENKLPKMIEINKGISHLKQQSSAALVFMTQFICNFVCVANICQVNPGYTPSHHRDFHA